MSYSDMITFAIGMVIIMMITLFFATKIQLAVFFAGGRRCESMHRQGWVIHC